MNTAKIFSTASTLTLAVILLAGSGQTLAGERDDRRHQRDHQRSAPFEVRRGKRDREVRGRETRPRHDRRDYFDRRVERRQDRQHARIRQGLRSGELTRHEARKLRRQHRRIEHLADRYSADGRLTKRERRHLARALDRASDRIYRLKHNDRFRDYAHRPHRHAHRYDRGYRGGLWYFDRY